ncbi:MAG: hypothetical protein Q7S95_02235 [bacterium]|nr:hypothetical protein [bacterium]
MGIMGKIQGAVGTISWIDSRAPAGPIFDVSDPAPADTVGEDGITRTSPQAASFRFSNYLKAWVTTPDGFRIDGYDFNPISGIYRPSIFAWISSHAYQVLRVPAPTKGINGDIEYVDFTQTAGARTIRHEVIGNIGGAVGGAAAVVGGAKVGAAFGIPLGPLGIAGFGLLGAGFGWWLGGKIARYVLNFPPIWTTIRLRIHANGTVECFLDARSHFPSMSFYCDAGASGTLTKQMQYDALAPEQERWEHDGWGNGNPWVAQRP